MAKPGEKMPFFHMGHDMMNDDQTDETDQGAAEGKGQDDGQGGDGFHHHQIDENEGGGYTSKHTGPDGKVTTGDHATYDDAKADMDQCCGQGGGDDEEDDGNDVAGHYGRAAGR